MRKSREKFQEERRPQPIRPLTQKQDDYLKALRTEAQIVVLGPAGTGKTFLVGTHAADGLRQNKFKKIIITRPNVPGGRSLGFFPGTLEEKIAPWVAELVAVMSERMGKGAFEIALKNEDIEIVPFEVMRGRSFKNALVILDEAQNTTPEEIKMFLTRIGEDTQVVINGDITQDDLKKFKQESGLRLILSMIERHDMQVPVVAFEIDDIVRSGICAQWVRAFHADGI